MRRRQQKQSTQISQNDQQCIPQKTHTKQAILWTDEILRPSRSKIHAPHANLTDMTQAWREIWTLHVLD
jgi:hypothetical protein